MPASVDLSGFIRSNFRSVWALELLLYLRGHAERSWSRDDLVAALRASHAVIDTSVENLVGAGLILTEGLQQVRYGPASEALDHLVNQTADFYAQKPDSVRRLIVTPGDDVSAFANAFKLRRD